MSDWIIRSENLSKKYRGSPFYSVENLNTSIDRGAIFGILGPNGAGKTTTLSMLCGLLKPSSGKIFFSSSENMNSMRKNIGIVPQELAIYPKLTARENLRFFGKLYGVDEKKLENKIDTLLKVVGLESRSSEYIQIFSTGMKRRINLAIGMVHDPKIILLDEPTVGIDPQSRNCIFDAIMNLKNEGVTVLYTTHYMEEASKLCDIVAIMDNGRIIMEGNPADLVKKHGSHRLYFGSDAKPGDNLAEALKKMTMLKDITSHESGMTVSVSNTADNIGIIDGITRTSLNMNVKLSLIKIEEPNLENLFLDLTGRNLRDGNDN
jgi:ABC-2 type transport system ATP-binding protein